MFDNVICEYPVFLEIIMTKVRQTWSHYKIKKTMGLFRGVKNLQIRFHFAFWRPMEAIGGKVYIGLYVEYDEPPEIAITTFSYRI
jgi:hypothetical protein